MFISMKYWGLVECIRFIHSGYSVAFVSTCCFNLHRTWSVPSHIPLPPLYLRRVALNGVQHRECRGAALNLSWKAQPLPAPLTEKYSGHDLTGFLLWKVAQTFYSGIGMAFRESYLHICTPDCRVQNSLHTLQSVPEKTSSCDFR